MSKPVVTVETITPEKAAEWLVGNIHNRNAKTGPIQKYAADMTAGLWDLNGESIKFNGDGRLLDGQNRLYAVVEAGVSITSVVVRGIEAIAQQTIDMGTPRKLSDVLKLRGEINSVDLGAGITRLWQYERDPLDTTATIGPSVHEALALLDRHPNLRASVGPADRARRTTGIRASVAVALHYITTSIDTEDGNAFWERLVSGADLAQDDPILHLRNILAADRAGSQRSQKMTRMREWALTVKAWNAYREGRKVKLLVWRPGGAHPEAFPIPA